MLKRVALVMACVLCVAASVDAGIRGSRSGGCPNGQCSMRSSYQTVAQAEAPAAQVADTAPPPAPVAEAAPAETTVTAAPQYVANSSGRGRFARRWSR